MLITLSKRERGRINCGCINNSMSLINVHRIVLLRHFLSSNPLTLSELVLKRKLDKLAGKKGADFLSVVHLKAVRSILEGHNIRGTWARREHVYNADHFPHLGNTDYIFKTFNDELNREVVRLSTICWLHFIKTFTGVPKGKFYSFRHLFDGRTAIFFFFFIFLGRFRASLRIRALPNLSWSDYGNNQHGTTISVSSVTSKGDEKVVRPLVTQLVPVSVWEAMAKRSSGNVASLDPPAKITFDSTRSDSWAWLHLAPFDIEDETADVRFLFRDVDNPWWKSGMEWDFVQLCAVK
jgi:hypothetical protein